jgi:hypothetical protein
MGCAKEAPDKTKHNKQCHGITGVGMQLYPISFQKVGDQKETSQRPVK